MEVFFKLHADLPQQGPGDDDSTRRALGAVPALPPNPQILDIGCGPGRQTLILAEAGGRVTALDYYSCFLDSMIARTKSAGLSGAVQPIKATMTAMPFRDRAFDLLWCEGAIFIQGFREGLSEWRRLLKPGGCLALTEVAWLTTNPPAEVKCFWDEAYPGIKTRDEHIAIIRDTGYTLIDSFVLPASSWWGGYYSVIEPRAVAMRETYKDDPDGLAVIDFGLEEIRMFRDHSDTYGYIFYIMQLPTGES